MMCLGGSKERTPKPDFLHSNPSSTVLAREPCGPEQLTTSEPPFPPPESGGDNGGACIQSMTPVIIFQSRACPLLTLSFHHAMCDSVPFPHPHPKNKSLLPTTVTGKNKPKTYINYFLKDCLGVKTS